MKRLHILGFICVCLGMAAMLLFRANTHTIAARPSSCGSWNVVPSPNGANNINSDNILSGIATISADDIWAVGNFSTDHFSSPEQTLVEHWNGTSWSIVPSPNVPSVNNILNGVTAVSATDIWAVGGTSPIGRGNTGTLVEHWDGTSWSIIPSPNLGNNSKFFGVAAVSASDIWAVGSDNSMSLIAHWDGSQWNIVPSPTSAGILNSVTAISTNNAWAVGMTGYLPPSASTIAHWNGSQWSIVQHPDPPYRRVTLHGVAAASATDIWAVGNYGQTNFFNDTLIEKWNGKKWNIVPGAPTSGDVSLNAVAVVSANNIWAVGSAVGQTLTEHWNGNTWSIVPSPAPGKFGNNFYSVASIPGSNYIWVVGNSRYTTTAGGLPTNTLTAYYC